MMLESAKLPIRTIGVFSLATFWIDATASLIELITFCGGMSYGAGASRICLFRLFNRKTSNGSQATLLFGKITVVLLLVRMVVVRHETASTRPIMLSILIESSM